MSIYTYVVDHGDDSPEINASTICNGGKVDSVAFYDALEKLDVVEEKLEAALQRISNLDPLFDESEFFKEV